MASPPWSTPLEEWQFLLARQLHGIFDAESWEARDGMLRFHGRFVVEPEQGFAILADRLRPMGYVPQFLRPDEIAILRLAPAADRSGARRWALPAGLFLLTVLSTYLVGGGAYAASIMGILLVHELGHYVTARRYGMRVSPPYFIPMPLSLMGTMGAIIRMRSPVPNRRALFDVGIAGPLAGLAVAIPVTLVGLHFSRVVPDVQDLPGILRFGEPLLFRALARLVVGPVGSGETILVHPVAFAGWLGFFVTALNLIPAGQLDGGHVAYAVLGRRHNTVALATVIALFGMALYSLVRAAQPQLMWAVWGGLLLIMGYRHPPPLDDLTPLDPVRRAIGVLSWALFLILITLEPFDF